MSSQLCAIRGVSLKRGGSRRGRCCDAGVGWVGEIGWAVEIGREIEVVVGLEVGTGGMGRPCCDFEVMRWFGMEFGEGRNEREGCYFGWLLGRDFAI